MEKLLASPRWTFAILFALLVTALIGASNLRVSSNNRLFFSSDDERYAEFADFEQRYGTNSEIVFLVDCRSKCEERSIRHALIALEELCGGIDGVTSVSSLASFPIAYQSNERDVLITDPLSEECGLSSNCIEIRDQALEYLIGRLGTEHADALVVVAKILIDSTNPEVVADVMAEVLSAKEKFDAIAPEYDLLYTGAVPMMQAFFQASQEDLSLLLPVALATLFLSLLVLFRNAYLACLLVGHAMLSVLLTLGVMGFLGVVLNTATSTLPLVILTLVIATNMHVYIDILSDGMHSDMADRVVIVRRVMGSNLRPIGLASLTTMLGLCSMVVIDSPPLRELGLWSAFGVLVGFLLTVLAFPSLVLAVGRVKQSSAVLFVRRTVNDYARSVELGKGKIVVVLAYVFLVFLGLYGIDFDEDFVSYFSEESEFRVGAEGISDRLHSPYHIEVDLINPKLSVLSASGLQVATDLRDFLLSQESVVNVLSIYQYLQLAKEGIGFPDANTQDEVELIHEQTLLAFELGLKSGQSTSDFISSDRSSARFSVLLSDVTMKQIRELQYDIERWFDKSSYSQEGFSVLVTGEGLVTAHLSITGIRQMLVGVVLALLLSSVVVSVLFRSTAAGVLLAFTSIVCVASGVAIWSLFVGSIGLSCTLVIALTVGVVVDDAIHIIYRYRHARDSLSLSRNESMGYSIHKAGPAITVSSIVLSLGFAVLALSEFAMNRDYGIGAMVVVLVALVYNLLVTPKLLSFRVLN